MKAPLIQAALVLSVSWLLVACGTDKEATAQGLPPSPVTTQIVEAGAANHTIELPARVHGSREVELRAQVSGILLERRYQEGDYVEKGDTLFLIDPEPFQLALDTAKAELASARALHSQATREWQRVQDLYQNGTVSEREKDQALSNFESAEARLAQAKSGLSDAERNLRYTRVEAPISGFTGSENASEGNLISAGSSLTYIVQSDPVYVQFAMAEKDLSYFRNTLANHEDVRRFQVKMANGELYQQLGQINFIDNRINANTSRIAMRGEIENPNHILSSGEFVRVQVTIQKFDQAVLVPPHVVSQGPSGPQVFVVDQDNKAVAKPVQLGPLSGDRQIILAGLAAGEKLIVNGHAAVRDGAPVQVTNP